MITLFGIFTYFAYDDLIAIRYGLIAVNSLCVSAIQFLFR